MTESATDLRSVSRAAAGELKFDPDEYWSPYRDLHDRVVDEHAKAVRVSVAAKIARALDVFAQRFGHLDREEREAAILRVSSRAWTSLEKPLSDDCSACGVRRGRDTMRHR